MAFSDLSAELSGTLPGVSAFLTDLWITRAWHRIRDSRLWSFLIQDDAIVCPPALTLGTYNITQYNNQVVADATASAQLAALNPIQIPVTFLQIRFTSGTGQIYNIVTADPTVPTAWVLTLDRAVVESSASLSPYAVFRCYISEPAADFLRWISVVDMVNGWPLKLDRTSVDFDHWDPQRTSQGQAYFLGAYQVTFDDNTPRYELWPAPTSGQTFYVRFRRQGLDFEAAQQNLIIPDELIVQYALGFFAYPWAMANQGHFPAKKGANWMALIADAKETVYGNRAKNRVGLLREAIRQDDNQMLQSVLRRGHGLRDRGAQPGFPVDASFIQSHLLNM